MKARAKTTHTRLEAVPSMRAPVTTRRRTTLEPAPMHMGLTLDAVDVINGCQERLLGAAMLLELGLHHMDDDEVGDPESIQLALLDVVDRLREDATVIRVTMALAHEAANGGAR